MKKIQKLALYGIAASALTMSAAFAAPEDAKPERTRGERPDPAERFAAMDADKNGTISLEEFTAAHEKRMAAMKERRGDRAPREGWTPPKPEEIFKRLDKDGNGQLTTEEMKTAREAMRGGQRGGGQRGGGQGGGGQGGGQGGGAR